MGIKLKVLSGVLALIVVIIYLIFLGLQESTAYYLTIDEFYSQSLSTEKYYRVAGRVAEDSIQWSEEMSINFAIIEPEQENSLPIVYHNSRPSNFGDTSNVILEGYWRDSYFLAEKIMIQCPSKYEAE